MKKLTKKMTKKDQIHYIIYREICKIDAGAAFRITDKIVKELEDRNLIK